MRKRKILSSLLLGIAVVGGVAFSARINKIANLETEKYKKMSDKHLALFLLMNQWVKVKQDGKKLSSFLEEKGYKKIAIYGMSYVGETLLNELREGTIQTVYVIDKQADGIYTDLKVVSPEEYLEEVDAIIVTPITFFEDIKRMLETRVGCPIISIEDILFKM